MKNKRIITFIALFITAFIYSGCNKDISDSSLESATDSLKKTGVVIMEISYDIKTSRDYDLTLGDYSNLDLASMNPSNEKQHIRMLLYENGQMDMTIEELDFDRKISIPHKQTVDYNRQIVKTEIIGNSIGFYTRSGKLLRTSTIELPNQLAQVEKVKEMGKNLSAEEINQFISTLQGLEFINNLESFIADAKQNGAQVLEENENYIKVRMAMRTIDARIDNDVEVLLDKHINKMVGSKIYGFNNELLESSFFGYNKGEQQYLNAIRKERKITLPSGKEVKKIILSKIDNFNLKLNV